MALHLRMWVVLGSCVGYHRPILVIKGWIGVERNKEIGKAIRSACLSKNLLYLLGQHPKQDVVPTREHTCYVYVVKKRVVSNWHADGKIVEERTNHQEGNMGADFFIQGGRPEGRTESKCWIARAMSSHFETLFT